MTLMCRLQSSKAVKSIPTVAAVAMSCMGLQAQAAALTYNFTGTISQFSSDVAIFDGIASGDTFAGTFTYDSASISVSGYPDVGEFDALSHLEASVHGFTLASNTLAGAIDTTLYHQPNGNRDLLAFSSYPGYYRDALASNSGSSICGGTCAPYYMQLNRTGFRGGLLA